MNTLPSMLPGSRLACAAALGLAFATASAAPPTRSTVTSPPPALNSNLIVDGNGVQIGGRLATFGTTAGIVSTAMVPLTPIQRAKRVPQACHFTNSFTIKNAGGRAADGVDIDVWVDQPQGPQVGKIASNGFGNPSLAPGASYTWNWAFDVSPGSYVYHLVVDRKHLNRQFAVNLVASCGFGTVPQMRAPAAQIPAPGAGGIAPSGGIGIARPRPHEFMLVSGVAGESKDPGHRGWIDLLSVSWQDRAANGGDGRCRPVSVTATMYVEKASPQLASLTVSGSPNQVTIDGPGGRRTLGNAVVSSVAPAGGGVGDKLPRESVSLSGSYCP
ncbi:MAG: type VI secretion system tube protein Hcp [Burkholderiales bacterium]